LAEETLESDPSAVDLLGEQLVVAGELRHALPQVAVLGAQPLAQFGDLPDAIFEGGKVLIHRGNIVWKILRGQGVNAGSARIFVMSDTPAPPVPPGEFDRLNPIRADAARLEGRTRRGRTCELIDNSGAGLAEADLRKILDALIAQDRFGLTLTSPAGGSTLNLDQSDAGHIQIGGRLFRLLVRRYTARIEPF
jgi:hypothetical protein